MSKKKSKNKPRSDYEIYNSMRREWPEGMTGVTKIIPDKRNKKPKHKKGWEEE